MAKIDKFVKFVKSARSVAHLVKKHVTKAATQGGSVNAPGT